MTRLDYESPRSRVPRPMRIQLLVLLVWLPMSMVGMLLGLYACVQYNRVAGTDLTKTEMTFITVSMNTGPFVGPLQGRNAFDDFYGKLIPVSLAVLALAWVPTLLVRRPLHFVWRMVFVMLHLGAGAAWYFASGLSLAYHLS